jgi:hypothetical protein
MILNREILAAILPGVTHYVDIGKGDDAVIYYREDFSAFMRLPGATAVGGQWEFLDNGYSVRWENGQGGHWHIDRANGFALLDGEKVHRGSVVRMVPGNPERFG